MSKTRGNVIDPSGYDPQLLRMYLMFINHYFEGGRWKDDGYWGCQKFRNRLLSWLDNSGEEDAEIAFQEFEEKAISFFEAWKTNRVVSEWMIFYNNNKTKKPSKKQAEEIRRFFEACF